MLDLLLLFDPNLQIKFDSKIDIIFWVFAISIIADMYSNIDLDNVKQEHNFYKDNLNKYIVENSRLFIVIN